MLLISDAQMAALVEPVQRTMALRIAQAAILHWPQCLARTPVEQVQDRVLASMDEARTWGLGSEEHFMRFFNLQLALGDDFHRQPDGEWARRVLQDRRLTLDSRLDLLTSGAEQRLRNKA